MRAEVEVDNAVTRLEGPLLFLKRTVNAGLNEAVEVEGSEGQIRLGRVAALDNDVVTIEVLESTTGLGLPIRGFVSWANRCSLMSGRIFSAAFSTASAG